MKKNYTIVIFMIVFSSLILNACGGSTPAESPAIPSEYAGKTNPLGSDAAAAGQAIYAVQCASCHGESGKGDGPAGQALSPVAANLVESVAKFNDDYLFYRISEGGAMDPYNSSMPSFKNVLSEEEIWQVVTHINTFK